MFSASKSGQYQGYQISRSVRIRGSASAFLNRTPSTTTNRRTFVWSGWAKLGALDGALRTLFGSQDNNAASGNLLSIYLSSNAINVAEYSSSYRILIASTQVFRDPSAWYHFVVAIDTTQTTASNRVKIYVNGLQITAFSTATYPAQNTDLFMNVASQPIGIGARLNTAGNLYFYDGYLTEVNFIDGYPTGVTQGTWAAFWGTTCPLFGVTNAYGVWSPIKYNGTYGTNGFYLNFSDNSAATAAAIGADSSGNGNNFTPNNISVTAGVTYDSMLDVPTPWGDGGNGRGNYATLNPLDIEAGTNTFSSANLNVVTGVTTAALSTFKVDSGKWYWEVVANLATGTPQIGVVKSPIGTISTNSLGQSANAYVYVSNGNKGNNNSFTAYGATFTTNDVIGVALDLDAGTITFYKNNVSQGQAFSGLSGVFAVALANCTALTSINFGQRPFTYTPPSGFRALNTFNLPEPSIDNGRLYMAATTYTGNGTSLSVNNTVNNASFQPDFVWVKNRGAATSNVLQDAVRGAGKTLFSNSTAAESGNPGDLITSFNSNGFTVNDTYLGGSGGGGTNGTSNTYIGWQWKEGAKQGFDIVTFTSPASGNFTVSHDLGVAPNMIIHKELNSTGNWIVYHSSVVTATNQYLTLNSTGGLATLANVWGNALPTPTQFSLTSGTSVDANTNCVAYLFASITGFSRFGSYTGNSSADGPFVFCGFRPRWIMIKSSTIGGTNYDWWILDTARSTSNVARAVLFSNLANGESTDNFIDINANGFKLRNTYGASNASGQTYIFAAFAENPFKYSLAR